MTGRKNSELQVPLVVPYKALEKFPKVLYWTTGGTCSARFFRSFMWKTNKNQEKRLAILVWNKVKPSSSTFPLYPIGFSILSVMLVHTAPEKFKNGVFTLKTHQMFSVHTTQKKSENATITLASFSICNWGKLWQGVYLIIVTSSQSSVFKILPVCNKTEIRAFFKFLWLEEKNSVFVTD